MQPAYALRTGRGRIESKYHSPHSVPSPSTGPTSGTGELRCLAVVVCFFTHSCLTQERARGTKSFLFLFLILFSVPPTLYTPPPSPNSRNQIHCT
ncbi:hypothetical protein EJ04DRAFT_140174 [Polyplosphaeria fusca]|uniref:Uncharacterized protein n=1 Tax=Polyplosphaeria fusca TaxID=682080 RepID=A0A9P4QHD6_9PLEO|nr:hypothetical protein EJ04DRAFT_140174 [Polyplosphaeria fusca]